MYILLQDTLQRIATTQEPATEIKSRTRQREASFDTQMGENQTCVANAHCAILKHNVLFTPTLSLHNAFRQPVP